MLQVDLLVAVQALPLQALSLLVLPLPWSLPKLLKLQLAAPISLFEGEGAEFAWAHCRRHLGGEHIKEDFSYCQ